MDAGKHVQIEIPLADSWANVQAVRQKQEDTGLICMAGHTRRFNPSHQYLHNKIQAGDIKIQQMDVETYFFRRKNINAKGRLIFFGARTSMPKGSRAPGRTICFGTMLRIPLTCSNTRPDRK
jgi:hypothetical protein